MIRTRAKEATRHKQMRVLLRPPGWDASPPQGYPNQYVSRTHFIHRGGERQCGVQFLVLGKKHGDKEVLDYVTEKWEFPRAVDDYYKAEIEST